MKRPLRLVVAFFWPCLVLLPPLVGVAEDPKDPLRLDNVPKFASTSQEPVLLRYKMKVGEVEKVTMDMDMNLRLAGMEFTMGQTMHIEAKAAVTAVDADGAFSLVAKITRMQTKMNMKGGPNVEFDSDNPGDNPDFKAVAAMINVGMPCKMSPVGKMLETDLEPLRLAIRRTGNAALAKSLEDSTKQMFEGTYIELSEKPVKAGDVYKAGIILADKARIHNSYKIATVSGDRAQVLLEPVPVLEMATDAFPEGVKGKIKSQKVAGWLLFDVKKGYLSKADVRMHMLMDITAEGQTGTAELTIKSRATSTVE